MLLSNDKNLPVTIWLSFLKKNIKFNF
jgi:hypothetical protein